MNKKTLYWNEKDADMQIFMSHLNSLNTNKQDFLRACLLKGFKVETDQVIVSSKKVEVEVEVQEVVQKPKTKDEGEKHNTIATSNPLTPVEQVRLNPKKSRNLNLNNF